MFQLTVECVPLAPILCGEEFPTEYTGKFRPKITEMRVIMAD